MIRWGGACLLGLAVLTYGMIAGSARVDPAALNSDGTVEGLTSVLTREISPAEATFSFEEVSTSAGIAFHHFPATRRSLLPEDMGSGLAWGDYDDDGDPDLYLVNFRGSILEDGSPDGTEGRSALYRNDGNGRFTDVSADSGLDASAFGMGAAWGDYDNDDDLDLYVTNYGPNVLYRNNGDGTFTDVTETAGVGDARFGAGCAWGDYNRDGWIDLYVCNYVKFVYRDADRMRTDRQYDSETPYTLNPSAYSPEPNVLYHNNGDGTFTDVAVEAGVADADGRSLGVIWFDFDDDGLTDLYTANDVLANGVFRNLGDGRFEDIGAKSLAADYRGAMGLAVADMDGDRDLDLFVTHWVAQENALYVNMISEGFMDAEGRTRLFFMDQADAIGLGQVSLNLVGWATGFADFDNDGNTDLWVVNGHTLEQPDDHTQLVPQRMLMFRHLPPAGFFEIGRWAGETLESPRVGRGGAQADYDGDGRMDLAVMIHGGPPLLLHNTSSTQHHWLVVRLRQTSGNTRALGARVTLRTGEMQQTAEVGAGGSYLSQSPADLHFGLGPIDIIEELTVRWPDGTLETLQGVSADQCVILSHQADYQRN